MNVPPEHVSAITKQTDALLPEGLTYFRKWRTVRWFIALVIPVFASASILYCCGRNLWISGAILLFGLGFAFALFVQLVSGVASARSCDIHGSDMNGLFLSGTFSRNENPILFWIQVSFTAIAYLAVITLGFLLAYSKVAIDLPRPGFSAGRMADTWHAVVDDFTFAGISPALPQ